MRIAISGASGIGKTRLAKKLAKQLHAPFIPDVIDEVLHEHGYRDWADGPSKKEERTIRLEALNRKIRLEKKTRVWVSDKSVVDYFAYWLTLAGKTASPKEKATFERLVRSHVDCYDRVILPLFGKYPVEHRVRRNTDPNHRLRIHSAVLHLYDLLQIPHESYDFKFEASGNSVVEELGLNRTGRRRIGLFLGTFDPFHLGHARVVAQALRFCDEVWIQPHPNVSQGRRHSPLKHRIAMIALAMSGNARVRVHVPSSRIQMKWYREKSVQEITKRFSTNEILVVMGSDKLAHPAYIKGPLLKRPHIILQRGALTRQQSTIIKRLKKKTIVQGAPSISGTLIRQSGKRAFTMVGLDPMVAKYIRKHNLYVQQNP